MRVTVSQPNNISSPPGNSLAVYVSPEGVLMLKDINGRIEPVSNYVSGNGGAVQITEVTYAEATELVNADALIPFSYYLITDFQTIYDQPDFESNGAPKTTVQTISAAISPIIIQAASENTFSSWALQPEYPTDQIKYDFTFSETEVMAAPAKGRITERVDSNANRTSYDHRVVLLLRYFDPTTNEYTSYKDNGEDSQQVLTFSGVFSGFTNNNVGDIGNTDGIYIFIIPNNVFYTDAQANNIQSSSFNNTFVTSHGNNIGYFCCNNLFLSFSRNQIGAFCRNNVCEEGESNEIGNFFETNIIRNGFSKNIIADKFYSNETGASFQSNNIGPEFNTNIIGANFSGNTIQSGFRENPSIGDSFQYNIIGPDFNSNTIGENFFSNNIQSTFSSNTIANNFNNNTIGNNFSSNNIDAGCFYNVFANDVTEIITSNDFQYNIFYAGLNGVDFTASTLVYQSMNCFIVLDQATERRLWYVNSSDVIVFANVNA